MKSLAFYTKRSLIFHVLVILSFFVIGKVFSWKINEKQDFNLKLVEASIRVDLVEMPKLSLQELKKLPAVVEQNGKDFISTEDSSNTSSNLAQLLKGLSKRDIEKVPRQKKLRQRNKLANNKEIRKLVLAGNQLSKGTARIGRGLQENEAFAAYLESLGNQVKKNWFLPHHLASENYQCRIRIYLNEKGKLLRANIVESSGNDEYDQLALEAVNRSVYFAPDKEFAENVRNGHIILGLPL